MYQIKEIPSIKSCFFYNFTVVSGNLIQIGLLGRGAQNSGEEVRLILYNISSYKKYDQYKKKLKQITIIFYLDTNFFENLFAG